MVWKKTTDIIFRQFNRNGLGPVLAARMICEEAERLYPGLFHAVSVRNGVLHLEVSKENQLALKLEEGKLLQDLAAYAKVQQLPIPTRLRLTFLT